MPIPYTNAVDEIYGIANATLSDVETALGYAPTVYWDGSPVPDAAPMDQLWIRFSHTIVKDAQASLAANNGVRRYHAIGLFFAEVHASRTDANAGDTGRKIAEIIRDAFRGSDSPSGAIWFRDQKIVMQQSTEENYPLLISVTFEYDSIQ